MSKVTSNGVNIAGDYLVKSLDEITAAGSTDVVQVNGLSTHVFAVTCTDYASDIAIRIEGSIDGTNWMNLDADESVQVITADGTTAYSRDGAPIEYVRVTYVSGSGTLNTQYTGSR